MKTLVRGIAVSLVALLASCGGSGGGNPVPPVDTVVLVYIIGSSLETADEGNASVNLKEMMAAGALTTSRVVVQTGGSKKTGTPPPDPRSMQPANVDWTRMQRYVVHPGFLEQVQDLGSENVLDPNRNMASPLAFLDFLEWAVDAHPASRYLVVLWDHGGGINRGVGPDDNTGWTLSVADIGMTLQAAAAGRGAAFELVGFDACLMANAEVATALALSSRYMVASQDLEPGTGWDYTSFLRYVDAHPTANGAAIGAEIARGFVAKQLSEGEQDVTLSVVDLEAAGGMLAPMNAFATVLQGYAIQQEGWNQIAKGRVRTLDWGTTPLRNGSYDLADLKGLVTNVVAQITSSLGPDPALETEAGNLIRAIDASVTTNAAIGADARATGLSIYFPSVLSGYPTKGYGVNTAMGRDPFFALAYTSVDAGLVQAYFGYYLAHEADLKATVTMSGDPAAPLSAVVQNDFEYALAGHQDPSCTVLMAAGPEVVPCFDSFRFPDEVTRLLGGNAWWIDTWPTAGWPTLSDGSGHSHPVAMLPDTYGGKVLGTVNDYVIPVHLRASVDGTPRQVPGLLSVREVIPLDGGAITYEVTGFREVGEAPGREMRLVDGQVYTVRVYATVEGDTSWFQTDRTLTVSGGTLTLGFAPVGVGKLGYFVTDLTGAVRESALVDYTPAR